MISGLIARQVHNVVDIYSGPPRAVVDIKGKIHDKTWEYIPEYDYSSMMALLEHYTRFFEQPRTIEDINKLSDLFKVEVTRYYAYVAAVNQYYHANLPPRLKRAFKHYIKTLEQGIHELEREKERRSQSEPRRPLLPFLQGN